MMIVFTFYIKTYSHVKFSYTRDDEIPTIGLKKKIFRYKNTDLVVGNVVYNKHLNTKYRIISRYISGIYI